MNPEQVLTLIERYGISLLITAIAISFVVRYFNRKLGEKPKNSVHQDFPFDYAIQSHSILSTLEYFYTNTVHSLCFKNQFKQLTWTDFLIAYFQAMHEYIEQGLQRNLHEVSKNKFKQEIIDWMIQLEPFCETQTREAMQGFFTASDHLADPMNVIIKKFKAQFQHNHGIFFQTLSEYTETPAFPSNKQRLAVILYALKGFSIMIMLTAEQTLNQVNGDLIGVSYKGVENCLDTHENTYT